MAGCGYVCPQCEGKGFTGAGDPCDWCSIPPAQDNTAPDNTAVTVLD